VPRRVCRENDSEVSGRTEDASVDAHRGNVEFQADLSGCRHCVYSAGRGKRYYSFMRVTFPRHFCSIHLNLVGWSLIYLHEEERGDVPRVALGGDCL